MGEISVFILCFGLMLSPNHLLSQISDLSHLHTSVGIGFNLSMISAEKEDTFDEYTGFFPNMEVKTLFHLANSILLEGNINYQYFPTFDHNIVISNEPYYSGYIMSGLFLEYGFLNRQADHYFMPTELLDVSSDIEYTRYTFRGYKVPYTAILGPVIGIGVIYFTDGFKTKDVYYSDDQWQEQIFNIQRKRVCPSLVIKLIHHSIDIKKNLVFTEISLKSFYFNKSVGFDISIETHDKYLDVIRGWIDGVKLGIMTYKCPWDKKANLIQLNLGFLYAF